MSRNLERNSRKKKSPKCLFIYRIRKAAVYSFYLPIELFIDASLPFFELRLHFLFFLAPSRYLDIRMFRCIFWLQYLSSPF
jgi:hypothetical protein